MEGHPLRPSATSTERVSWFVSYTDYIRKLCEKPGTALKEYKNAMAYTGDFPQSQFNMGILSANLGDMKTAQEYYKKAIKTDNAFYPAKVNLAMLYNREGENDHAEKLLRQAFKQRPDMVELAYSLGLLEVIKKNSR